MRLTRQIDESAGFFAEALGEGLIGAVIFLYAKPHRVILLLLAVAIMEFRSWADMRVMHDHDQYFFAYVEQVERRTHH